MMPVIDQEKKLARYLLRDLPEQERMEIEDRYITDGDIYEQLLVAEDELIDDYVRGELSARDRELFERNFLTSPGRRERVKSARTLMKFVDVSMSHQPARQVEPVSWPSRLRSFLSFENPAMRLAYSMGLAVAIAGGILMWVEMEKLRSGLEGLQARQVADSQREQELNQQIAQQKDVSDRLKQELDRERQERGGLEQVVAKLREQQTTPVVYALGYGVFEIGRGGSS